ncbi:MAG: RcnB family protein [Sphingomonas sp.]|nr:RcnB family protein [Sphingomonas sp.]
MRRFALAVLIAATAAAPVFAQSALEVRRTAREQARSEKVELVEPRAERKVRAAKRRAQVPAATLVPVEEQRRSRPAIDRAIHRGRASTTADRPRPRLEQRSEDAGDSVANWRRERRALQRELLAERRDGRIERRRVTAPANARPDRPAPPPRTATRRVSTPRWGSSWHNDHRYDWRDHRRRHRSLFRLGFYFDPFGWSYRRFDRGWRLWPSYYDSSYWLHDPFSYRLPRAPYPYKWIRYWDDALLVDTFTGEVVDVAHDFFW